MKTYLINGVSWNEDDLRILWVDSPKYNTLTFDEYVKYWQNKAIKK